MEFFTWGRKRFTLQICVDLCKESITKYKKYELNSCITIYLTSTLI